MLILCGTVFNYLSLYIISLLFNLSFADVSHMIFDTESKDQILALKLHNTFTSLGTWLFTSWFFLAFRGYSFRNFIQINPPGKKVFWVYFIIIFVSSIYVSSYLLHFNSQIEFFKDVSSAIEGTLPKGIMKKMLVMDGLGDFAMNIFFIALVPAVLEEIFFRGVLQNLLSKSMGVHVGVIITSIIFAGVHLNPLQIIPMFFLAATLGYVYHYSGSIYSSILIHFLNNSLAVAAYYYSSRSALAKDLVNDAYVPQLVTVIGCAIMIIVSLVLMKRQNNPIVNE